MADKNKFDTSKSVKNPLLTAAGVGFPIENFTSNALLLPVSQNVSNILPTGKFHILTSINYCFWFHNLFS